MTTELTSKVLAGDVLAAARLITGIENEVPAAIEELRNIHFHTGKAYSIGVTGSPGCGKSTLVDSLVDNFRKKGMTIGIVAVDPTSPFTGGAVLGDRIRMQRVNLDEAVFIRSLATRGSLGVLARATLNAVHVMDAMGKDLIVIETVGSGQTEVEITNAADTTLLVLTPDAGDDIQIMKAGILEAADIFVINKVDKGGADDMKMELEVGLAMRTVPSNGWKPGIVLTEATADKGTGELVEEILRHKTFLIDSGELENRRRHRARWELIETIEALVKDFVHRGIDKSGYLEELMDALVQRKIDPRSAALQVLNKFSSQLAPRLSK